MKELRFFVLIALFFGLIGGCAKEGADFSVNEPESLNGPELKTSFASLDFGNGVVSLSEYHQEMDQTIFTYTLTAGSEAIDQLNLGIVLCRLSPEILSVSGATVSYGSDPRLKKYKEFKNVGWLILTTDIPANTSGVIEMAIQGMWKAEPNESVLFSASGFQSADLEVPVCFEGTLASVETIDLLVGENDITVSCEVTDDGGTEVYDRGVMYSFSEVPDVNNNDGIVKAGSGVGPYQAIVPLPAEGQKIYVVAYAYNSCPNCYTDIKINYGSVLIYPEAPVNDDEFTDSRDGKVYRTVQIGTQTWMAENLAYIPEGTEFIKQINKKKVIYTGIYVYNYLGSNIDEAKASPEYAQYGCLYNWEQASTLCPDGWHLPSDAEWKTLERYLGMPEGELVLNDFRERTTGDVGSHLKSSSADDWFWEDMTSVLVGDNSTGFTAKAGGYFEPLKFSPELFHWLGQDAFFWTATSDGQEAFVRDLKYSSVGVGRYLRGLDIGFSVRCVQDLN